MNRKEPQNRVGAYGSLSVKECSGTCIDTGENAFLLDFGRIQKSGYLNLIISNTMRMRFDLAIGAPRVTVSWGIELRFAN